MPKRGYLRIMAISIFISILCLGFLVSCTGAPDKGTLDDAAGKKAVDEATTGESVGPETGEKQDSEANAKATGTETQEEKALVERFQQDTKTGGNENVLKVFCEDFDANGTKEAFILTGKLETFEGGYAWLEGKVWFVNDKASQLVQEDCFTHFSFDPQVMTFDGTKMLHVYNEYATGCCSYLYGVVDNQLCRYFDYAKGSLLVADGQLQLIHDTYDYGYDKQMDGFSGHTWKPYYLYFAKATDTQSKGGKFREYGAIEISQEQFLKFQGAQDMLQRIRVLAINAEITGFLYRENNIININYLVRDENGYSQNYVTVNYNEKEVYNFVEGSGGKYEKAIIPEIATYPVFKEPQN